MDANLSEQKPWMTWTGRVFSFFVVGMLLFSASMKLTNNAEVIEGFTNHFGYPAGALVPIGVVEILCALLYAIPRTRVLGAILVCSYLGGAVATHVRVSEPYFFPILFGVVAWAGLWLRDARIRRILPLIPN